MPQSAMHRVCWDFFGVRYMAFIPGYDFDIFVSYAHVDNQPFLQHATGWVSTLVGHLQNELGQKLGRPDAAKVWFDSHHLRGNHALTTEIAGRLQSAALFVAVLSPGYTSSQWCQEEARLFEKAPGGLDKRIFAVEKAPLDDGMTPPALLRGLRAYRFWYRDSDQQPRTLAMPTPRSDEINYFRQVEDLARDLRDQCRRMSGVLSRAPAPAADAATAPIAVAPVAVVTASGVATSGVAAAPVTRRSAVLLAEVTDDLEFRRGEVQRYIEQRGVPVLPERPYPLGRADFTNALAADLDRSRLFVQLLGPVPGKRPVNIPDGYGWLQLEGARRSGLPVLQWRSPDLDPDAVEWPHHRDLLELPTVQATSLETFKYAVMNALTPPPAEREPRPGGDDRLLIFLNTEPCHSDIAALIRDVIGTRAAWTEPLSQASASAVRQDFEDTLVNCDAMVMVYSDNPSWARAQLRSFHRLAPRRERPVRAIPVIDAPPLEKPNLGFSMPEMIVIDGRRGVGKEALDKLCATLRL
jgi:hypothetical protein